MEGIPDEGDPYIYAYTDRPPTKDERKQREKEPLTLKQKRIFRAIKEYVESNGRGPTKRGSNEALRTSKPSNHIQILGYPRQKELDNCRKGAETYRTNMNETLPCLHPPRVWIPASAGVINKTAVTVTEITTLPWLSLVTQARAATVEFLFLRKLDAPTGCVLTDATRRI